MLDPELPEDGNLRDKLQKERLVSYCQLFLFFLFKE